MPRFDVIVLGLGAVGSAAAYNLARRGRKVLGFDRYSPPHSFGSSHGETRVTRAAIGEAEEFSPLALRSHEIWRDLERQTGNKLFNQCGCLFIPSRHDTTIHGVTGFFANVEAAAKKYRIPHQRLTSAAEIRRRFPAFAVHDDDTAFLDRAGGYVFPEACIEAQLGLAKASGVELRVNRKVAGFSPAADGGVRVTLEDGSTAEADQLLITAGAWLPGLIGDPLKSRLHVTRQVLHWFEIRSNPQHFSADENLPAEQRCPVFIWDVTGIENATSDVYGFPTIGDPGNGVKIAHEEDAGAVDPDTVSRTVDEEEIRHMFDVYVAPFFPDLGPRSLRTEVCLYTRAPNGRFVVDRHPENRQVMFASACSGHGFGGARRSARGNAVGRGAAARRSQPVQARSAAAGGRQRLTRSAAGHRSPAAANAFSPPLCRTGTPRTGWPAGLPA
jgi:sarcosine oxidase